jgi:hypothetical protein
MEASTAAIPGTLTTVGSPPMPRAEPVAAPRLPQSGRVTPVEQREALAVEAHDDRVAGEPPIAVPRALDERARSADGPPVAALAASPSSVACAGPTPPSA